jgi:hypothetical protein
MLLLETVDGSQIQENVAREPRITAATTRKMPRSNNIGSPVVLGL